MKNRLHKLRNPVFIRAYAAVGGKKEGEGPLGELFDYIDRSDRFGKNTWEQSEAESQAIALNLALNKQGSSQEELDAVLAGDLINQCSSSSYGLMNFGTPFLGIFGACSTCAEGLLLSSFLIESGHFNSVGAVSSSHFCSAERQFRAPVEYGGQRAPTSQWTVTGAGAFLLDCRVGRIRIGEALAGRIVDAGMNDPANMGAAMAPAAFDSINAYFSESEKSPEDFDLILTGDLGREGHSIIEDLSIRSGLHLKNCADCGMMIYGEEQDVHAGGSGCGCSATVLAAKILPKMEKGEYKNVLFAATGALMSADAVKQGLCIPGIAHLVTLTTEPLKKEERI